MVTDATFLVAYGHSLRGCGRERALRDVLPVLRGYHAHLLARHHSVITATTDDVEAFRAHLASPAATVSGIPLARTTQGTRLGTVRAYHRWLHQRGHTLSDPAKTVSPPSVPRRPVTAEPLSQQEAYAFLEAASAAVTAHPAGTHAWALALRDLAMLALALATGRRVAGLCAIAVAHIDHARKAVRIDREKNALGRVLPVADWALAVVAGYQARARSLLLRGRESPWLFPGRTGVRPLATRTWDDTVRRLHREVGVRAPDLSALAAKAISTHSLRVTFASLLFRGGCDIRVISELMLHQRLTTTAAYTPLTVDDLRDALIAAHPRT